MDFRHLQNGHSPLAAAINRGNGPVLILPGKEKPAASREQPFVLNSWKEISAYLGRGVRTVQRWEHDLGLPVHRPKGRDRSAVLAIPVELNAWLNHTPVKSNGNGNGVAGSDAGDIASVLLALARDLLTQGERLVQLNRKHRPDA